MRVLRNGGSATDAVEIAIITLEDREITNAGYGSNLAMDGAVEGDATIVDHFGRSGAVGAVSRQYSRSLFRHYLFIANSILRYRDPKSDISSSHGP